MAWYSQTREVRVSERGRATTSKYAAEKRAERTLRVRKATPQEIADRKRDAHKEDAYQPLTMNGRIVW